MKNIYEGELWFLGWKADHKGNRTVTFELPDDEALECFKGMTAKKGKIAGQILMAVLVEPDENGLDENIENDVHSSIDKNQQHKLNKKENKPKGGPLSKLAGQWSNNENFKEFIKHRFPAYSNQESADFIRWFCKVKSRSEIDHTELSKNKFMELRKNYMEWREENH